MSGITCAALKGLVDLNLLGIGLQSRSGGKPLKFQVVCPQNGTAVLKGLTFNQPVGQHPRCGDE